MEQNASLSAHLGQHHSTNESVLVAITIVVAIAEVLVVIAIVIATIASAMRVTLAYVTTAAASINLSQGRKNGHNSIRFFRGDTRVLNMEHEPKESKAHMSSFNTATSIQV